MERVPIFEPPDRAAFANPFNDRELLAYYDDLLRWHGYIRFLGMPHRRDEPDVPLEDLYVEPLVSRRSMGPDDLDPEDAVPAVGALVEHPRLVLLGDPGSGKSTLVSWIALRLSRSRRGSLRDGLGDLVPAPMVLREMTIGAEVNWESLWTAFLELPVAEKLRGHDGLDELLAGGQVIFLLDGLDELSSVEVRKALRRAVFEGMARHPRCRFLLTSRLVGYDDVPFHVVPAEGDREAPTEEAPRREPEEVAALLHVAPFTDLQIERFAANWYASREKAQARATGGAHDLIEAVRRNEHTLRLARIPNLLTFMALIHRVRARLPDGRALLYDDIAEAYLETIDRFRGLQEMDFPLHQKMRWLGFVAYKMQQRRDTKGAWSTKEILARQAAVEKWLVEEMKRDQLEAPEKTATAFLVYLGKRSGLLLPRGEGVFAFAHLSFQEFFAATYLLRLVMAPQRVQKTIAPSLDGDLRRYGGSVAWRETLILLFELLTRHPDFTADVLEAVLGENLSLLAEDKNFKQGNRAVLLAEIAIDPHSAVMAADRPHLIRASWFWERIRQGPKAEWVELSGVPQTLLRAESHLRSEVIDQGCDVFRSSKMLRLESCPNIENPEVLKEFASLHNLSYLVLSSTRVEDLSPLASLKNLSELYLRSTRVEDLSPLSSLKNLRNLDLSSTGVEDLSPLASLKNLSELYLSSTGVEDLSPLAFLDNLRNLDLSSTRMEDLSPLAFLKNLRNLYLSSTRVKDLSSLASLDNLNYLDLSSTRVEDLSPLASLENLRNLDLSSTRVMDLSPLERLEKLNIVR